MNALPGPVDAFFEATNAGDVDRFVEAFAADGVIDDWGRTFAGHDGVRQWTQGESIGVEQTFEVTSFRIEGRTVVVMADVGGNGFTGPSTFTFDLTDDGSAIERMVITA
ncbi:nuclear transport factor 2 family protein [Leifsonia flava]|uniref:Nuclear transport factor 2 family protein n=1 Tax=Orlajensenia leifsoniae TaxID=2561933 RepID=A0A4Y9QN45_9MICO|nr:nuclear transport factor 2 family protein [Leifsonia flava]TFV94059.1 nuclear transport factor 2 family protein [Leifsonia flava]